MIELKKAAQRNRVQFVDRVASWTSSCGGPGVRRPGLPHRDRREYVFNAKAVVVCNGDQNYRCMPMWACTRGEGLRRPGVPAPR